MRTNNNFTYFIILFICMLLQIINKVKVTDQGHIKVKVQISTSFQFYVKFYLLPHIGGSVRDKAGRIQAGGAHHSGMLLF